MAFGGVGLFSFFVYEMRAPAPAVSPLSPPSLTVRRPTLLTSLRTVTSQLPRAYPHDGLVQALSGTEDSQYAVRSWRGSH